VDGKLIDDRGREGREACQVLLGPHGLAPFLAEHELVVDQVEDRPGLIAKRRAELEIRLDGDPLAPPPSHVLVDQQGDGEDRRRGPGSVGGHHSIPRQ
jgi:hypothetical protein